MALSIWPLDGNVHKIVTKLPFAMLYHYQPLPNHEYMSLTLIVGVRGATHNLGFLYVDKPPKIEGHLPWLRGQRLLRRASWLWVRNICGLKKSNRHKILLHRKYYIVTSKCTTCAKIHCTAATLLAAGQHTPNANLNDRGFQLCTLFMKDIYCDHTKISYMNEARGLSWESLRHASDML